MTLVVAVPGKDFIVLGADSRGTIIDAGGTRVEVNTIQKIIQISKHVAIMLYGDANQALYLIEQFKNTLKANDDGITSISKKFQIFCIKESENVLYVDEKFKLSFGFVIGGLDKKSTKYSIPKCHSLSNDNGFWLGSYPQKYALEGKPMIPLYLMSKNYKDNMDPEEIRKLVAGVINETKSIDGDVGGKIRMGTIDTDGFRTVSDVDINDYVKDWEKN